MIRDAGFDGAGVRFFDREYARQVTRRLREWGLTWQAQCYPQHGRRSASRSSSTLPNSAPTT